MNSSDLSIPPRHPSPPPSSSLRRTQKPDASWQPGDGLGNSPSAKRWREDEEQGWKCFDPDKVDRLERLMTSGIVPRPIALVASLSAEGIHNLAPYSWFQIVSCQPPVIMFSARQISGRNKDTVANIVSTREFTVNMVSEPWIEASNFAAVEAPSSFSEWPGSGLQKEPSEKVKVPRVRESAFSMECEVYNLIDIPGPAASSIATTVVFGLVRLIHVRKAVLTPEDIVDPILHNPAVKLGGVEYGSLGTIFSIERPSWSDLKDTLTELEEFPNQLGISFSKL